MDLRELVAALDLGSNSFHMIVARLHNGQLSIMDKLRERVRLGAGLDRRQHLDLASQARALECLQRLGERLRDMPAERVRVVGTNTLRQARNAPEFIERANALLGHPIEIIGGREEARLIYLGAQQTAPAGPERRLVIDIGGGSTECIIGQREEVLESDSLFMGCVSHSRRYFGDGVLSEARFLQAEIAAQLELQTIARRYRGLGWTQAFGCSGTVHAIKKIGRELGLMAENLTQKALRRIRKTIIAAGHLEKLQLQGLTDDRREVIAGGLAILSAIFDTLGIEEMVPARGALREGVLYDLVGRIQHEDVRDRTIRWMCRQHAVDLEQVARVERTAFRLLDTVQADWGLEPERSRRLLSWSAQLHELGLSISHTGYHRHGAYVVENADMAGFSWDDQKMLAALIRGHRRKLKLSYFHDLPAEQRVPLLRLAVLFRLAVCLHRSRSDEPLPRIMARAIKNRLTLIFPPGWLETHPLARADLELQAEQLAAAGMRLTSVWAAEPR